MLKLLSHRPPQRFRHAFRVALAVVIAYFLALSFGWQSPHWAALAISTVSMLPGLAESLAKGKFRILGTLVGACFSLILLGLFYQDRWPFLLCMALWLAFCTYRMTGSVNSYFWLVAGFVAPIIALRTGMEGPATAFLAAVERTQETLMGICVYMLVVVLVWPEKNEEDKPAAATTPAAVPDWVFPDPDRLVGAIYVFATYCLGSALIIHVPAFPSGGYTLALLPSVSMAIAAMPFVPLRILYRPIIINILLGAAISILVLPLLTSFLQLAVLLFAMTFYVSYRFFDPSMAIGRSLGLAFFFVLLHVNNEQKHDFTYTVNLAAMMLAAMWILLVMDHFPLSRLPEKRFAWQLKRFARSARFLASGSELAPGPISRYLRAFHRYEIGTLPQKLSFWRGNIPPPLMEGHEAQLDTLLADVNRISESLLQNEGDRDAIDALYNDSWQTCLAALVRPRFF